MRKSDEHSRKIMNDLLHVVKAPTAIIQSKRVLPIRTEIGLRIKFHVYRVVIFPKSLTVSVITGRCRPNDIKSW